MQGIHPYHKGKLEIPQFKWASKHDKGSQFTLFHIIGQHV